jgi:5-methyltetrahydropteroyltriglutamate--homocysteine methyltransferase
MGTPRAHVVGSLLRPRYLLDARDQHAAGTISAEELAGLEDAAVDAAVALQEACGIDVITDGEQRRGVYFDSLSAAVSGITSVEVGSSEVLDATVGDKAWHSVDDESDLAPLEAQVLITDKLVRSRSVTTGEFRYVQRRATKPVKVTLSSPSAMATLFWSKDHSTRAYRNALEAMDDLAAVLRQEVADLAALGCRQIQLDAPDLTFPINEARFFYEAAGLTRDQFIGHTVELLDSIAEHPGVTFSLHLCRGNNQGSWHTSGGYDSIAHEVFPKVGNFEYLFLEYDDERSGTFESLAEVPDDMVVVLGMVSTKRAALEDRSDLERRIRTAARFHPHEQLALSPQCGFASAAPGNPLSMDAQRAKLELIGDLAAAAWS